MKKPLYDKMTPLLPLVAHDHREIGPTEELIYRLALGNTFNVRVVGLESIKRFRRDNPNCAITFKPNHLSEADFIVLGVLFRRNGLRVMMEGGNNLFIEEFDIFRDVLPSLIDPKLQKLAEAHQLTIGQ